MIKMNDLIKPENGLPALTSVLYHDAHLAQSQYYQDFVSLLEGMTVVKGWHIEELSQYISETINLWRCKNDARLEFMKAFVERHYKSTMASSRMQNLLEIGALGSSVFLYSGMDVVLKLKVFVDWLTKQFELSEPEAKGVMRLLSQPIKSVQEKAPTIAKRSLRSRRLDDDDTINE